MSGPKTLTSTPTTPRSRTTVRSASPSTADTCAFGVASVSLTVLSPRPTTSDRSATCSIPDTRSICRSAIPVTFDMSAAGEASSSTMMFSETPTIRDALVVSSGSVIRPMFATTLTVMSVTIRPFAVDFLSAVPVTREGVVSSVVSTSTMILSATPLSRLSGAMIASNSEPRGFVTELETSISWLREPSSIVGE